MTILFTLACLLVPVLVLILFFLKRRQRLLDNDVDNNTSISASTDFNVRINGRLTRRVPTSAIHDSVCTDSDSDNSGQTYNDDLVASYMQSGKKIGTKKLKKLQAKEEKRRQRLQDEEERKTKKLAEEQQEKDAIQRAQLAEKQKKEKEAELKRLIEIRMKKDEEEYLKLKQHFNVEEEGTEEGDETNFLAKFVEDLKSRKFVNLGDLTDTYKLRVTDLAERIRKLLEMKILTGILDEKGNFIYINDKEIELIVAAINQRGKFTLPEFTLDCNIVIQTGAQKLSK
ncbi:hypothetical protein GJ496_010032 [Pomphorhynchus laevis]|nr:hypothetical protein GJ496_010032 [Pomphorhynchus laevis]